MICKDFLVLLSFKRVTAAVNTLKAPAIQPWEEPYIFMGIDDAVMTNRTENLVAYPIQRIDTQIFSSRKGPQQLAEVGHCGPFRVMDWVTPASAACSGQAKGQATNCVTELRTPS
jgi:hypothetical protein